MGKSYFMITISVIFITLLLITIFSGLFNLWSFFGMIFYVLLYLAGYVYIKIGYDDKKDSSDIILQDRQKFGWCFERVNKILRGMPGGEGLEWHGGFGRKSTIKSYNDGIQNKPFRSIMSYLEKTQQLVIIIYNIEDDDIADFNTNPSPEYIENPFLNFKPFTRGVDRDGMTDRFGGFNSSMRYPPRHSGYGGGVGVSPKRGISINVNDGFGDFEKGNDSNQKTIPQKDVVDSALDKLKR